MGSKVWQTAQEFVSSRSRAERKEKHRANVKLRRERTIRQEQGVATIADSSVVDVGYSVSPDEPIGLGTPATGIHDRMLMAFWPGFHMTAAELFRDYRVEASMKNGEEGPQLQIRKRLPNGRSGLIYLPWPTTTGEALIANESAKSIARLMTRIAGNEPRR